MIQKRVVRNILEGTRKCDPVVGISTNSVIMSTLLLILFNSSRGREQAINCRITELLSDCFQIVDDHDRETALEFSQIFLQRSELVTRCAEMVVVLCREKLMEEEAVKWRLMDQLVKAIKFYSVS